MLSRTSNPVLSFCRFMVPVTLLSLLVVGCGQREDGRSSDGSTHVGVMDAAQTAANDVPELEATKAQLLSQQGGSLRFDRIQEVGGEGQRERQIYIEMIGDTAIEAADRTLGELQAQGFQLVSRSDKSASDIHANLQKSGRPDLKTRVRSRSVHGNLVRDDATSSVYITYALD